MDPILLGKGIGYGRKAGEPIERQPSDRVFLPLSNPDAQPMLELFSSIPASYLELTQDIVDDAEQSLGVKLSAHIYLLLTDHLQLPDDFPGTEENWHAFFATLHQRRGLDLLLQLEPLVRQLTNTYTAATPQIYDTVLFSLEKETQRLHQENLALLEKNLRIQEHVQHAASHLLQCPITKLNNEKVYLEYLEEQCKQAR